jgi:hypothetical protein
MLFPICRIHRIPTLLIFYFEEENDTKGIFTPNLSTIVILDITAF